MGILDDFDDLNVISDIESARFYIRELKDEDSPAMFQAWYDIFMEEFDELDSSNKILYLNILKQEFPRYHIWNPKLIYNEETCNIDVLECYEFYKAKITKNIRNIIGISNTKYTDGILGRVMKNNINAFISSYLNELDFPVYDLLKQCLLKYSFTISDLLKHGLFRDDYYVLSENDWAEASIVINTDIKISKISTKYSEIKHFLKQIIDSKIKIGELE